ncbi:MAG: DNA ligase D [Lysobacteraceae bacterium]
MSLQEYRRKRRFDLTREPAPAAARPRAGRPIFVVQLHHARRRHYDFRLQVGDVLRSWAVPKGPSFDPAVKRLAVEVEDHPLDYADFEGEIPQGQYGGGHVALYDRGLWTTDGDPEAQLRKGHLRFELFGGRLVGGWHLVRTHGRGDKPQWLLFKEPDAYAGPREADDLLDQDAPSDEAAEKASAKPARKLAKKTAKKIAKKIAKARLAKRAKPDAATQDAASTARWRDEALALSGARRARLDDAPFAPQLATTADTPPSGPGWVHEIKWDGYRIVAVVVGGRVRLWSRNALEWTGRAPDVVAAIAALGLDAAAFDGELIAGGGRRGDFNLLQAILSGERHGALSLVLFDLLHLDGVDVSAAPLGERKALLEHVLAAAGPRLRYSAHVPADGAAALALAADAGFEGLLSKRIDRPYRTGRSDDWRKSKRLESETYAVVGSTPPKGSRSGFGALLLARPDGRGGFVYAGRVGSGFSDDDLRQLAPKVRGRGSATPSVPVPPNDTDLRAARWFAPAFLVEVYHRGTGGHGLLRQASFKGLRLDKTVDELATAAGDADEEGTDMPQARKPPGRRDRPATAAGDAAADVVLTHPERVVFPGDGRTKGDVFAYYRAMADWILPEIAGRPLSVVRCPDGTGQPCFFQKHALAGLSRVDVVRLPDEGEEALVVHDVAALLELVQFNAIEFHPWGACADAPALADVLVFDLDPGPGVDWPAIVDAARQVRGRLREVGLRSFVRTSGGKGLHVVVPLSPACDWTLARQFAHAFADGMAATEPLRFVASASKRRRDGRIFVDYLRNGRGATSVASFSLRARAGAPVAMPLRWEDLGRIEGAAAFDIDSAPRRMRRVRGHPWGDWREAPQDLAEAIAGLA